jgi:UDP-3-O-acyl-N-acetylglucosamine deacetylase
VTTPQASSPSGRRTVQRDVTLSGVGMHTGATSSVTFRAAAPGAGVCFRRVDLPGKPEIAARLTSVTGVERRTTLAAGKAEVHTV